MTVAFTGTRRGLTRRQRDSLQVLLELLLDEGHTLFVHGDCIGADTEAHRLANSLGFRIHIRPSTAATRAFNSGKVLLPAKSPLERNIDIVEEGDILVACPRHDKEITRSGTWHAVRSARKCQKRIIIVWPDGSRIEDNA